MIITLNCRDFLLQIYMGLFDNKLANETYIIMIRKRPPPQSDTKG